jgi:hypothetical protein
MRADAILLPLLAQVFLTLALYAVLAVAKRRAMQAGLVDLERRALHDDAWPESVIKVSNNIRNQFQLPVLFYVLVIVLWQLGKAGPLAQALAWLFVASRVVHAWVHTGSNVVALRRGVFTFGWVVLAGMTALALVAAFD